MVGFGIRTYEFPMIKAGVSWRKDLTTFSTHAWKENSNLFFCYCTLPETNNLPLKIGLPKISKMKGSSSNHQFSGAKTLVSGRVTFFRWKKATLWSFFLFPCQVWCLQRSYPQTEAASWASEDFWKYFCLVGAWENCCGVGYSNFFLGRWCTFGWCTLRVFFCDLVDTPGAIHWESCVCFLFL